MQDAHHTHWSIQEKIILSLAGGASLLIWVLLIWMLTFTPNRPFPNQVAPSRPVTRKPALLETPVLLPSPTFTLVPTHTPIPAQPTATSMPTPGPTARTRPSTIVGPETTVIALLGIDESRRAAIWRTDSIVLVLIDEDSQRVGIVSIPRDLWVTVPGHGPNRINTVDALGERTNYPGGGPALLDQTLRYNLGIPIDHYARIDHRGFEDLIDEVGGITIDVKAPIDDVLPDPLRPNAWKPFRLPAGLQHMDGQTALSYCRVRMATSDFDRSRRQRQVIVALWKKTLTLDTLVRAPKLWDRFNDMVDTDLGMVRAMRLAYMIQGIGLDNVRTLEMGLSMTREWVTPSGAQVLLPRTDAIQNAIRDLLLPSE